MSLAVPQAAGPPREVLLVAFVTPAPGQVRQRGGAPDASWALPDEAGFSRNSSKQPGQQTHSFCTCVCTRGVNQSCGEFRPCSSSGVFWEGAPSYQLFVWISLGFWPVAWCLLQGWDTGVVWVCDLCHLLCLRTAPRLAGAGFGALCDPQP